MYRMSKSEATAKKYLVTGAAGFIGANFVKYLVAEYGESVKVIALDALTYAGNLSNIAAELEQPGVTFVHADITDAQSMRAVFAEYEPDYVVNFAAESHVDRSITGPAVFVHTNVLGTQTLLDAARSAWSAPEGGFLAGKRFLQISTDEVYGTLSRDYDQPQPIEIPDDIRAIMTGRHDTAAAYGREFFTELTPLSPSSPYSASKASADMLALAYYRTFGMPVCITRCSNNYGPWQFPEKLIPLMINNIVEGRELPVYGEGLNVRDWLYVTDHCAAIDMVLRHGTDGEVYNIGGFNEKANIDIVREIIALVAEYTGTAPRYDLVRHVTDRKGHDARYAIDPAKTVRALGWYPRTPFTEGIRHTVRWYLDNRDWTQNVTSGAYREYYDKMYNHR